MPNDRMAGKRISIKGFTLIELLVVISIIALLLSILMPALGKAKYIAQKTVCGVHVRQQVIAQLTYASAHDGKFPQHWGGDPLCVRDTKWYPKLGPTPSIYPSPDTYYGATHESLDCGL